MEDWTFWMVLSGAAAAMTMIIQRDLREMEDLDLKLQRLTDQDIINGRAGRGTEKTRKRDLVRVRLSSGQVTTGALIKPRAAVVKRDFDHNPPEPGSWIC